MDDAGFIIGSYVITFAAIGLYAWTTIRRGRRLAKQVPDDDKYWT
jgi:heme exporter protein CcmD